MKPQILAVMESPFQKLPPQTVAGGVHPQFSDAMIIVTVIVLLALLAAAVIFYFHRSRRSKLALGSEAAIPAEQRGSFVSKPKRRRRRALSRNPTRAETGGLPPVRHNSSAS